MLAIGKWYTFKVWKDIKRGVRKKRMKLISIHNGFARFESECGYRQSYGAQDIKTMLEGGVIHE